MRIFFKSLLFIAILTSLFTACKSQKQKPYRQDVSDKIFYLETPVDASYGYVMQNNQFFKPLPKENRSNLNKLLQDSKNLLWLRISFTVDEPLKNKMIALYISQLHSSAWLWCNGNSIRKYGSTPPHEVSCGTVAQYYMFPIQIINYEGDNTIYIQVWPGPYGAISNTIFLGEQPYIFNLAERHTFFKAKISIAFFTIMMLIFFLYLLLYFVLRKSMDTKVYLFYSLISLFTAFFLTPFCISEISWAIPSFMSFLMFLKLFLNISAFVTVHFANSFMLSYLHITISKRSKIIRFFLIAIPSLIVLLAPNYEMLSKLLPVQLFFIFLDFVICTPRLIIAFKDKEKFNDSLKLLLGFMPVLISVIADVIIRTIFKIDTLPFLTIYGWQISIYIFLFYLVQDFGNTYVYNILLRNQVEELNTNLEQIVAMRTKELSEANYVLSRGLESVAQVQKNFLPPKEHLFKGWDFSVYFRPLDNNVSGDLYDYYYTNERLDGFGIFDVSGHGIPAGLMTILSKGIISQHFIGGIEQKLSLTQVLKEINDTYIKEKVDVDNYITGLLFRFSDLDKKKDICTAEVANAGHPYPLFYNAKQNTVEELKYPKQEKQFGIIGVEGLEISFPTITFTVNTNDIILCFTDGLTEATNKKNEEFSKERVIKLLQENAHLNSSEIVQKIIESFSDFTKASDIHDDITLIVLKRNSSKNFLEGI